MPPHDGTEPQGTKLCLKSGEEVDPKELARKVESLRFLQTLQGDAFLRALFNLAQGQSEGISSEMLEKITGFGLYHPIKGWQGNELMRLTLINSFKETPSGEVVLVEPARTPTAEDAKIQQEGYQAFQEELVRRIRRDIRHPDSDEPSRK